MVAESGCDLYIYIRTFSSKVIFPTSAAARSFGDKAVLHHGKSTMLTPLHGSNQSKSGGGGAASTKYASTTSNGIFNVIRTAAPKKC